MLKQSTLVKIIKILTETQQIGGDLKSKLQDAQSTQFKSLLKLEMKTVKVPAEVMSVLQTQLVDVQILADQRENEIDEAMDEQAERKFCLLAGIKKRFALKEKLAQKNS